MEKYQIQPSRLVQTIPEDVLDFTDTADVPLLDSIVGQDRAVEAIDFGLNMIGSEYNVFVTGLDGTGRSSIVRQLLKIHARDKNVSQDICLVNNFDDEYRPMTMEMPAGTAVYFSRSMSHFIEVLKVRAPEHFETEAFRDEQEKITRNYSQMQQQLLDDVAEKAQQAGLALVRTEEGYQVVPAKKGQPLSQAEFDALTEKRKTALETAVPEIESALSEALLKINKAFGEMNAAVKALVAEKTGVLIAEQIDPIRYYFKECEPVQAYLRQVRDDIIDKMVLFLERAAEADTPDGELLQMDDMFARRYQVNVLVDRRNEKGAPVVFESNPSFENLFGRIEKQPVMGGFTTDFTMVQAGSLLKASNGYLVIPVEPILRNEPLWEALKRTLQESKLQIEEMPDMAGGMPSLKPAPISLNVKVILIGGYEPFRILQSVDSKFNKIFKVRADFDYETRRSVDNIRAYAQFIARVCQTETLLNLTPDGVWQMIEYGSRLTGDREKLSLRFGLVRGLLKEADFWARKAGALKIDKDAVNTAVFRHRFRHNLYEEKVMEQFDDASVLLDVNGAVVGQVNALAVYDMGEISFGRPARITAESYMGNPGIIDVEHESDLSGQTHDKGVMIISGYLGRMFAKHYPLSVSISITFEQSYDGVDGDSASSSELYAVLSSLSDIPIRQEIAVTGSVNQKGEIQAIGGVNEKVEGFFDVCERKGLTGNQGVMIPGSNVRNLVLREDVLQAVQKGQFHLYSVRTIEEGIEVLTGVPAGTCDSRNQYPPGTLFGSVQKKLAYYHKLSMQFNS